MRKLLLIALSFLMIVSPVAFAEPVSSAKSAEPVDHMSQSVWVVDIYNCRVEKFDNKGNYLNQFGSCGSGDGQFNLPTRLAIDSKDNIWVVDTLNNRVQKFDGQGHFITQIGCVGIKPGDFVVPVDAAIDSGDNLWVLDADSRVQEFDSKGTPLRLFGSAGVEKGQFYQPTAIAIDHSNNIWIADVGRVQEFNSSGTFLKSLGAGNKKACLPSNGCNIEHWLRVKSIAIDSSDNLWLLDTGKLRKMSNNGDYRVFRLPFGAAPGSFLSPATLTVDGNDNIWITDTANENSRVQILNNSGVYLSQFGSTGKGNGQFEGLGGIVIH